MYTKPTHIILFCMFVGFLTQTGLAQESSLNEQKSSAIHIGPFQKNDALYHQGWIQESLDGAGKDHQTFIFAPGEYFITGPKGLLLPANSTLIMQGARFLCAKDMQTDGQCFLVENISNVSLQGGEVIGQRDEWDAGTNIAGVRIYGDVNSVCLSNMTFKNLSSNAVGMFGESEENPIKNVTLSNVRGINCCNFYGDYLSDNPGPAKGSHRKDQGTVAFYYVNDWLVSECRFEQSQSDGTHFYHSHNGIFVDNFVADSKMGGYFIEGCEQVLAADNIIIRNGSRGCTIERDSRFCTLADNLVAFSGREGLWAPNVEEIIVTSNIFRENGQKDDKERDCEIRLDNTDRYEIDTADIQILNNIFHTNKHQTAVIYLDDDLENIMIENNIYRGPAPKCNSSIK